MGLPGMTRPCSPFQQLRTGFHSSGHLPFHPAPLCDLDMTFLPAPRTLCLSLSQSTCQPNCRHAQETVILKAGDDTCACLRAYVQTHERVHSHYLWVLDASTVHLAQEVFVEGVGIAKSVQPNNRFMMQSDVFGTGGSLAIAFGGPAPLLGSEHRLCCCGLGFQGVCCVSQHTEA